MTMSIAMLFWFVILPLGVIAAFVFLIARLVGGRRGENDLEGDETRLIQEIYQGLVRMEKRVEALETILLDKTDRTESKS